MKASFVALLLPITALATPFVLETRAQDLAAAIQKNLTQIRTDVVTENNTLNEFGNNDMPTFFQALALQQGGDQIESDINSTTATSNKSAPFTSAESTKIYNQLNNQLLPATTDLLNNFIRHYPGLKAQGLAQTVHDSLVTQRNLVQIQGKSLTAKSSGPSKSKAPALTNKFVAAFNKAITKYSS